MRRAKNTRVPSHHSTPTVSPSQPTQQPIAILKYPTARQPKIPIASPKYPTAWPSPSQQSPLPALHTTSHPHTAGATADPHVHVAMTDSHNIESQCCRLKRCVFRNTASTVVAQFLPSVKRQCVPDRRSRIREIRITCRPALRDETGTRRRRVWALGCWSGDKLQALVYDILTLPYSVTP